MEDILIEKPLQIDAHHHDRTAHNKANLNRIRRIQGQLNKLAEVIEGDEKTCSERVIQARAIEKGMTSLINHLVTCHIENTIKYQLEHEPEEAREEIVQLVKLLNR